MSRLRFDDERGLIGKILMVWLLVVALLGVVAFDAGSILMLRFRTNDLAGDASTAAADAYAETGDEQAAKLAALGTIAGSDDRTRLRRIDVRRRLVTVEVTARTDTLVVGWVPFLDDFERVTVTRTSEPPP